MKKNNLENIGISGMKWSSFGIIGKSLFQIFQIIILTRYLSVESFGLVAMALFVINFTNIFVEMGFTAAILHYQNADDKEYSSVFWFSMLVSFFMYVIIFLLSSSVANFYGELELELIISILGSNIILLSIGRVNRTILQKNFKFKKMNIIDFVSSFFGLFSSVILAICNYGIYSLIFGTLIASFVSSLLLLIYRENKIYFYFHLKDLKPFFKVGSFSMSSSVLSFLSNDIDILIIGKTLGPKSLGFYSLSKQLILKIYSIVNPIVTNVLSPLLSSIQHDRKKIKSAYLKVIRLLSLINVPIYLFIIFLSQEILTILYGHEYIVAKFILSSLAVAYCINSISNPVGSLQIATGRTDIGLKWTVLCILINPIVFYLASLKNIDTVAISRAFLTFALIIPLWYVQLKPMLKVTLKEYLLQFYMPLLFFLFMFAANYVYLLEIKFHHILYVKILIKFFIFLALISFFINSYAKKDFINLFNKFKLQLKR